MKLKKCRICKEEFFANFTTKIVCSIACALIHAKQVREKKQRKADAARRQELKTPSTIKKEAQVEFNKFIRLRDHGLPCISCQREEWEILASTGKGSIGGLWDAGHYLSRGARPEHRFNEDNCHKQCKRCNGGSGNFSSVDATVITRYRENLIEKIGEEKLLALESDHEPKKYTREQLLEIKRIYRAKWQALKKLHNL